MRKLAIHRFLTACTAFALFGIAALPVARAAEIAIVQPANKETIHSNLGEVAVRVRRSGKGSVRLLLDGSALPQRYRGDVIQLRGIDRGSHTLRAELLGRQGEVLATSRSVTFYLWHASRLFPHPSQ